MLRIPVGRATASRCCHRRDLATFASDPRWPGWQAVIGIEVHVQIKSRAKLFSQTRTAFDQPPNTQVSLFDAAFPGTLPNLNIKCVELAVRTALAMGSDVQKRSTFDRKHYFYPDLPSGYQITQKYAPLAMGGQVFIGQGRTVSIEQIQLEQDTAKSTKSISGTVTRLDLNRAGAALMEIVSRPDMRTPEEAGAYVRALQALLRAVGASDGNMEQGSLRCDVNVSVNRKDEPFGTRCEVKNLNSVRFLMSAILSEVRRHTALLDAGCPVPQETRGFDQDRAETFLLRTKEDAPDYRYMPDSNLPPLLLTQDYISAIAATMPELPSALYARLQSQYGISARDTEVLMSIESGSDMGYDGEAEKGSAVNYFEQVADGGDPKVAANWIIHELLGQLAFRNESFHTNPVSVETMRELLALLHDGTLTGTSAKTLLRHILQTRTQIPLTQLIDEMSLRTASSTSLKSLCEAAVSALPRESDVIRKGNEKVVMKLVGHVMKASRGTANARAAADMLREILLPPKL
ncbi:hypothetical protein BS47DRAFT_1300924 [Hydnum rufescens UP504]|uniref:Glutamyl-tRNA(Gln) amidotransferase subunit B, mitochondrial n=1 Tax=Hydnum rufescens UP504 TaxID=1448309 RepID=A0A9P6AQM5_9AGAM|nr:hypothetical protein BS47DRAFT_1300924 [Hydnum rufescens UP504]